MADVVWDYDLVHGVWSGRAIEEISRVACLDDMARGSSGKWLCGQVIPTTDLTKRYSHAHLC